MQYVPRPRAGAHPDARQENLYHAYQRTRALTPGLAAPLSAEDCVVQSMPDASPVKWQLAHTSWLFETFVLEPALPGFAPYREAFRVLFNSYCVAVGPRHRVFVGEFEIAERLATNAEYQAFVADGGYRRPEL